jgi:hypothetical protein
MIALGATTWTKVGIEIAPHAAPHTTVVRAVRALVGPMLATLVAPLHVDAHVFLLVVIPRVKCLVPAYSKVSKKLYPVAPSG